MRTRNVHVLFTAKTCSVYLKHIIHVHCNLTIISNKEAASISMLMANSAHIRILMIPLPLIISLVVSDFMFPLARFHIDLLLSSSVVLWDTMLPAITIVNLKSLLPICIHLSSRVSLMLKLLSYLHYIQCYNAFSYIRLSA